MNKHQKMAKEFHGVFNLHIGRKPQLINIELSKLRIKLIQEELDEYKQAVNQRNIIEIADALADILYVTYGAAVCHGIDIAPIYAEVHRSKLSRQGDVIKCKDGKVLKPHAYSKPQIRKLIIEQM